MSKDILVKLPPYLCARAYDLFADGKVIPLGDIVGMGSELLASDFQAYSTQPRALILQTINDVTLQPPKSTVRISMSPNQLQTLKLAQSVVKKEFGNSSIDVVAIVALTEILIHAQNRVDDAQANLGSPPEFFSDYLPISGGRSVEIEPYEIPKIVRRLV